MGQIMYNFLINNQLYRFENPKLQNLEIPNRKFWKSQIVIIVRLTVPRISLPVFLQPLWLIYFKKIDIIIILCMHMKCSIQE